MKIKTNVKAGAGPLYSSRRFKDNIVDMGDASASLLQLRPVTFHYKPQFAAGAPGLQYGLVAEEVAEIYPDLVGHAPDGRVESVLQQFLAPMLLNELQRQQRTIAAQAAELTLLASRITALEVNMRQGKRHHAVQPVPAKDSRAATERKPSRSSARP